MNRAVAEKSHHGLAKPVVKKLRWPVLLIWLAPIFAAGLAGYYGYRSFEEHGLGITISFKDGDGLKPGQTKIMHLGVEIGEVSGVQLSPDDTHVMVTCHLQRSAMDFTKEGTKFWIVRPEISMESISGLGTVLSGPYIDCSPGTGKPVKEFTGLDKAPAALEDGLHIVLKSPRIERLQAESPVYFRGIQVGVIESVQLSSDAAGVDVRTFIHRQYAPLVKSNSEFWIISAVDVKGGLITGIQMKVESLHSLLTGGIAFATPDKNMGEQAQDGSEFVLNDEPKKEWTAWEPKIQINPDDSEPRQNSASLPKASETIQSAVGSH